LAFAKREIIQLDHDESVCGGRWLDWELGRAKTRDVIMMMIDFELLESKGEE
jgi:hypothetical protein